MGPRTKTRARPLACAVRVVLPSLSAEAHAAVLFAILVYVICMSERLLHGVPVSDERIQAWADEAERGYDLADLPAPRPGRPPVGKGPGVVVTVRLDAQTLAALMERAALEGIDSRSDAVRAAVREWTHVA